jgi:hypothetical protein
MLKCFTCGTELGDITSSDTRATGYISLHCLACSKTHRQLADGDGTAWLSYWVDSEKEAIAKGEIPAWLIQEYLGGAGERRGLKGEVLGAYIMQSLSELTKVERTKGTN